MCNAWNHDPDCTCGFGGEGHAGGGGGAGRSGGGGGRGPIGGPVPEGARPSGYSWKHADENFCAPTSCPRCGHKVFFVRHNGGSVWLNDLGWPWPKHECFDNDADRNDTRQGARFWAPPNARDSNVFGVIIEADPIVAGKKVRIVVRCSDGSIVEFVIDTRCVAAGFLGELVLMLRIGDKLELVQGA